jgi:hypothetical protein
LSPGTAAMTWAASDFRSDTGHLIMNTKQASQILSALIQGIDPATGEPLPAEGVLHRANVLRAMLAAVEALEQQSNRATRRAALPKNVGVRWTSDEERELVTAFQRGDSLVKLAETFGRTVRSVELRLQKLGLITPDQRLTQDPFNPRG